jgi:hypothetical protein
MAQDLNPSTVAEVEAARRAVDRQTPPRRLHRLIAVGQALEPALR